MKYEDYPALPSAEFPGLSKKEYAAILIAAGLSSDPQFCGDIPETAIFITNKLMADLTNEGIHSNED